MSNMVEFGHETDEYLQNRAAENDNYHPVSLRRALSNTIQFTQFILDNAAGIGGRNHHCRRWKSREISVPRQIDVVVLFKFIIPYYCQLFRVIV